MIGFLKPNQIFSTGRCKFSESAVENCFKEDCRKIEKINRERCANRCSELEWCRSAEHHLPSVNLEPILTYFNFIVGENRSLFDVLLKIGN